jgi:hypothetical protein
VSSGELGELFAHVDLKIRHQGAAQSLPNLQALLGTFTIDGALDLKQRIDPTHHLDCDRRERDFLFAGGLAPGILFNVGHGVS